MKRNNELKCSKLSIVLPLNIWSIILPGGLSISAPLLEPDIVGYIVPYMEPPISPYLAILQYGFHNTGAGAEGARPTVVEAAEGRLHIGGW